MKIGFFEVSLSEQTYLKNNFKKKAELSFAEQKIDAEHLPQELDFEILSVFTGSPLTAEVLSKFSKLKDF